MKNNIQPFITGSISMPATPKTDKVEYFTEEYYKILVRDKLKEDQVCIIAYKTASHVRGHREVYRVYKTVEDFKNRFVDDANKLDRIFGIQLQVWIYD